jgi:hypothetical protein
LDDELRERIDEARRSINALTLVYPDLAQELSNLRVRVLDQLEKVGLEVETFERAAYVMGLGIEAAFAHKGPVASMISRHPQDANGSALRRVLTWGLGIDPSGKDLTSNQ